MLEVRACTDGEEYGRAIGAIGQYFNPPPSEEWLERFVRLLPHERMHAALEDGAIVGGAGAFPFELSVPGGRSLPCGGVTAVGVQPTHRRRGVLRAMMDAQLRDIHERGEPIAALWASEETIYGRFGYGNASRVGELKIAHEWDAFAQPLERRGTVRFVDAEDALELFPPVYDAACRRRPGLNSRSGEWWAQRQLYDEEKPNAPKRFVVLEIDGEPQAYAIYRTHFSFSDGSASSRLAVIDAVGATPQATAEIWRYLLDVDWTATVEVSLVPPDHELFSLLATPRRARYRMGDGLWIRLVDLPAALSGRAYGEGGPLVLEVQDAVCEWNDGRWRLSDGGCERTDEPPDLALDAAALGAVYLGAISFAELRNALRLAVLREGAVERADALFAWRPLPWCPEIF